MHQLLRPARLPGLLLLATLSGCMSQPTPVEVLPDLEVVALELDDDNFVVVSLKNSGEGLVPLTGGRIRLLVGGDYTAGYELTELHGFPLLRPPGGAISFRTNARIAGDARNVAVVLDPQEEIREVDEFQNAKSHRLEPSPQAGPDFRIAALTLTENSALRIVLDPNAPVLELSPLSLVFEVFVDGVEVRSFEHRLDPWQYFFGQASIAPEPPVFVTPGQRVRVQVRTLDALDELDTTNNTIERVLPDGPDLEPYLSLLSDERIAGAVVWVDSEGDHPYPEWSAREQAMLLEAIVALEERGQRAIGTEPPAVDADGKLDGASAWRLYLQRVAHSLWLEAGGRTAWSLRDLPVAQRRYILDADLTLAHPGGTYDFSGIGVTDWNPRLSYDFLRGHGLVRATPLETIRALTSWMRGHLCHGPAPDPELAYGYSYPARPPVDRVLFPPRGHLHWSEGGCWTTSGLYLALLHSVNIPVLRRTVTLNGTHSTVVLPSVELALGHADDVYTQFFLGPSSRSVPTAAVFIPTDDMERLIFAPTPFCLDDDRCHTQGAQASWNLQRRYRELAHRWLSDSFLDLRKNGAEAMDDWLRELEGGIPVVHYRPFFDEEERAAMIADAEAELERIGGTIDGGSELVATRSERFLTRCSR